MTCRAAPKTAVRDKRHREGFRHRRCTLCGGPESIGHHIGHDKLRDDHTIALCGSCHGSLHRHHSEALWWAERVPDLVLLGLKAWAERDFEEQRERERVDG